MLSVNTFSSDKKSDSFYLWVLIAFTLFFRLYMLQIINVGPDEIDYWFSAKRLAGPGGYPELMHRTIRWSLILPVAFFQLLLGSHPLLYYLTPILNSLVQTVLLYYFGRKLFGRGIAFYAVILFTAWPYMWRTGSQIRPAIFSLTYVLVAIFFLFIYLEKYGRRTEKKPGELSSEMAGEKLAEGRDTTLNKAGALGALSVSFIGSVVFLFLAYESKITNLYFVPGILIVLWIYTRNIKVPLLYGVYLFVLYVIEHLLYFITVGEPLGRLGIIAKHHLTGDFAEDLPNGFFGLFARYTEYLEFPWHLLLLAFVAATVYLLIKKKRWVLELTILHASFFFFLTFMVKSLNPMQPVEPFLDRYFIVNLPTMSLVVVYAIAEVVPVGVTTFVFRKSSMAVIAAAVSLGMLIITALPMPSAAHRFYTPLSEIEEHPVPKTFYYIKTMEKAIEQGVPIVSVDTRKPIDTANRVFYDRPPKERFAREIAQIEIEAREGTEDGAGSDTHTLYYLEGVGGAPQSLVDADGRPKDVQVLWCDRFNFDMTLTGLRQIELEQGSYSDL